MNSQLDTKVEVMQWLARSLFHSGGSAAWAVRLSEGAKFFPHVSFFFFLVITLKNE